MKLDFRTRRLKEAEATIQNLRASGGELMTLFIAVLRKKGPVTISQSDLDNVADSEYQVRQQKHPIRDALVLDAVKKLCSPTPSQPSPTTTSTPS